VIRTVEDRLERVAARIDDAMAPYLQDPGGPRGGDALTEQLADYPARGGKGLRPALLLATCEAYGGAEQDAWSVAVSIELLHNAFLVHDDIEDGSDLRRGEPTLHRRWGVPAAINAGDAMAVAAVRPIHDDALMTSELRRSVLDEWFRMAGYTVSGQATELAWRTDPVRRLTPDDYLDLILRKTCWYTTIFPLRAGAMVATRNTAPLDELSRFGFLLGAAFQIRDDLLDLTAASGDYGKDVLGDLWEGKRTLMLVHLMSEASPSDLHDLRAYLAVDRDGRTAAQVQQVREMMERTGSIEFAQEFGRGIAAAAADACDLAFAAAPRTEHRDFVVDLVPYMLARPA
jgi:geranylgeranyl diphosphate synthase, type II